jgi:hypothetical protein
MDKLGVGAEGPGEIRAGGRDAPTNTGLHGDGTRQEHSDTIEGMNNLASVLRRHGKHEQGKEIYRQAFWLKGDSTGQSASSLIDQH